MVYPNGISTSLPRDVQDVMIASIPGLETAAILQYGYAIEYDFIDPRSLSRSLELKALPRCSWLVRSMAPQAMKRRRRRV